MNGIFTFKENEKLVRENHKAESQVPTWNQITFGEKTVKRVCAKLWNNLPCNIKSSQNLEIVKSMIDKYICSGPLVFESQRCRV